MSPLVKSCYYTFTVLYSKSAIKCFIVNQIKRPEIIKQELLVSIVETSDKEEDYLEVNEEVKNAEEPKDGISLVKKYEDFLKGANKKIINTVGKQGESLKRFKDSD